jgi:DNA polymerase-3 subunit beta
MSQFSVKSSVLNGVLKRVVAATDDKQTLPAFSGVKLVPGAGRLQISTYSPAINVEAIVPVESASPGGAFGLGLKLLVEVVASLPAEAMLGFVVNDKDVHIRTKGSNFKLNLVDDVVSMPDYGMQGRVYAELNMPSFMRGLDRVVYCHDDRAEQPYRRSVCINSEHFVSTDGYRLSHYPNRAFVVEESVSMMLSTPLVERLAKIYSGIDGPAGIGGDSTSLYLNAGGIYTTTRLMAGTYPNYKSILPKTPSEVCEVNRKALAESLKRAMILVGDSGIKQVDFVFSEIMLHLSASGAVGDSVESVEVTGSARGRMRINAEFVLKALTKMEADKITLEYRGPLAALILTDGEHVNVFQPIHPGEGVSGQ